MCTKFEKKILICFELSRPQGNFYGGGGATDLNPIYPRLSSGDIITPVLVNLPSQVLVGRGALGYRSSCIIVINFNVIVSYIWGFKNWTLNFVWGGGFGFLME